MFHREADAEHGGGAPDPVPEELARRARVEALDAEIGELAAHIAAAQARLSSALGESAP